MKIYQFPRGGLEYLDPTAPSFDQGSQIAFLPALSVIPLIQGTGSGAEPVVSLGDRVEEGMLIARGRGPGSASVHATVPGRIVRFVSWRMADGRSTDAFVVKLEGSFGKLGRREERNPWEGLSRFDLLRIISERGLVEMEAPGRPLSEILGNRKNGDGRRTLVLSCVFDDPWLAADYALCRERGPNILAGLRIAAKAAGAERLILAVSFRDLALAHTLLAADSFKEPPIEIVPVGNRYPQRNRRELENALRSYAKGAGLELAEVLILNPATFSAVYDAVALNKPVLERYVAVGGGAVKKPGILRVRIGTRIGDVFAECGGFAAEPRRIAVGSPLRGMGVSDLDEPITKTTSAVFALTDAQVGGDFVSECINCGECRAVCPVGLDPELLYKLARMERYGDAVKNGAAACHGCGCCEIVCSSRLPLSTAIRNAAMNGDKSSD